MTAATNVVAAVAVTFETVANVGTVAAAVVNDVVVVDCVLDVTAVAAAANRVDIVAAVVIVTHVLAVSIGVVEVEVVVEVVFEDATPVTDDTEIDFSGTAVDVVDVVDAVVGV